MRVIEYEVPDHGNGEPEVLCLVTTLTGPATMPAARLAQAYHQRWESEGANAELKTALRGPGRVLRSHKPDLVRQEIYGYLLTHHALTSLICAAATEADTDPDRVKFTRTVRIARRRVAGPAAFSPEGLRGALSEVRRDITRKKNLNPRRRRRSYPRVVKRARHHSYRIKRPSDAGTCHAGAATIHLVNLPGPGLVV